LAGQNLVGAAGFRAFITVDNKYRKAPVLEPDLCLGCGVCVHKCPTDSLTLVRKENIEDPPENMREYGMRFIADRKAGIPLKRQRS
jgi:formate hydrogenlyase subunit 6/NADH:ubiquinone oxidoreductase subunit I